MTCIIPQKAKAFDEEKFLKECVQIFSDIREKYQLDEQTLKLAQPNPLLDDVLRTVQTGCTEKGILQMKRERDFWCRHIRGDLGMGILFPILPIFDETAKYINSMSQDYDKACSRLRRKIDRLDNFKQILNEKESLALSGNVAVMFFLGKLYEEERFYAHDKEKARAYYQKAKDTWTGILYKKYEAWLTKAVQDSGLELIGNIGRAYMSGDFGQASKKDHDRKLKKEIKWLTEAVEAGDGWAAFTKGNICYYGYGRWKQRKKEAYNNYLRAAQSKDSIYALELGECQLRDGTITREVCQALSDL
mgnify:CR=1 FL=1